MTGSHQGPLITVGADGGPVNLTLKNITIKGLSNTGWESANNSPIILAQYGSALTLGKGAVLPSDNYAETFGRWNWDPFVWIYGEDVGGVVTLANSNNTLTIQNGAGLIYNTIGGECLHGGGIGYQLRQGYHQRGRGNFGQQGYYYQAGGSSIWRRRRVYALRLPYTRRRPGVERQLGY
jgi:hypothetical protein